MVVATCTANFVGNFFGCPAPEPRTLKPETRNTRPETLILSADCVSETSLRWVLAPTIPSVLRAGPLP